jgi:hypothetical protein
LAVPLNAKIAAAIKIIFCSFISPASKEIPPALRALPLCL